MISKNSSASNNRIAWVRVCSCYPREPWVEHFEWLEPLFNERLEIMEGRMLVPTRPGLGVSSGEQARTWVREEAEAGTDRQLA